MRSAESLEAQSAESRSDVAPKVCKARADANLNQGLYLFIYLFIYLDVCTDPNNGADVT